MAIWGLMTISAAPGAAPAGSVACRWAAGFLAFLLVLFAWEVDSKELVTKAAHHQVCCLKSTVPKPQLQNSSGNPFSDWAGFLSGFINNRYDDSCLHVFGVGDMIIRGKRQSPSLVPAGDDNDGQQFEYRAANFSPTGSKLKDAQCASIALLWPREPLQSSVDFFTPEFLDDLTGIKPTIRVELGTAVFDTEDGGIEITDYSEKAVHFYDDKYVHQSRFATEEELQSVISKQICKGGQLECDAAFAFIEAVTGTRIPEEYEVGSLTKEDLRDVLTLRLLEGIDYNKQMRKLEKEIDNPTTYAEERIRVERNLSNVTWRKMVPQAAVKRLTPNRTAALLTSSITKGFISGRSRRGTSTSSRSSSRIKPDTEKQSTSRSRKREDELTKTFNFSSFTESQFKEIVENARRPASTDRYRMTHALSIPIAQAFSKKRPAAESGRMTNSRRSSDELSRRQINEFLLVNSLLAVSKTKYSDILAAGAMHRLERMKMPIFAVCGKELQWKSGRPPTGSSSRWLSKLFRFEIDGFEHSSFEYRKLNEASFQEDLSDSAECAILGFVGRYDSKFRSLTRRPFNLIFGIFTREQMVKDGYNYKLIKDDNEQPFVSIASRVDPWEILSDSQSTKLDLGQLFDKVAKSFRENNALEFPEEEAAKRARRLISIGRPL